VYVSGMICVLDKRARLQSLQCMQEIVRAWWSGPASRRSTRRRTQSSDRRRPHSGACVSVTD